jgi:hypothetical protein
MADNNITINMDIWNNDAPVVILMPSLEFAIWDNEVPIIELIEPPPPDRRRIIIF